MLGTFHTCAEPNSTGYVAQLWLAPGVSERVCVLSSRASGSVPPRTVPLNQQVSVCVPPLLQFQGSEERKRRTASGCTEISFWVGARVMSEYAP